MAVPSFRQILRDTADAEPVGMHARTANGLDDAESALAIVERIKDRRKLAQILRERAVPDQVADDPEQFREHHANDLRPGGTSIPASFSTAIRYARLFITPPR